MSLNFEEFSAAIHAWHEMDERLNRLIGFNPATSNHYGQIKLYNQRISIKTTDEKIIMLRSDFLNWKREIWNVFKRYGVELDNEQFSEMFSVDYMFGTMKFLDIYLDVSNGVEKYEAAIKNVSNNWIK